MARLRTNGESEAAPPPVITRKIVTETQTQIPPQAESQQPSPEKSQVPHLSDYVASIPQEEYRHHQFYLYRDSDEITKRNPNDNAYLARLYPPGVDVKEDDGQYSMSEFDPPFPHDFWNALQAWTRKRFGGRYYHFQLNNWKVRKINYNLPFEIDAPTKLSPREGYRNGNNPASTQAADGSAQQLLGMVMKNIDERLAAVTQGRQDPQDAFQKSLEAVSTIQNRALELALSRIDKNAPPANRLADLKEAVELVAILERRNNVAPAADPNTQLKSTLELMDLIERRRNPAEEGIADKISTGVVNALKGAGVFGKRAVAPTDWSWLEGLAKSIVPVALPLLARFIPGAGAGARTPEQPIVLQRTPAANPPGNGAALPLPLPGDNPPAAAPASAAPAPTPAAPQPVTITPEIMNQIRWHDVTQAIVDWIRHDMNGAEAAQTIKNMFPDQCAQLAVMNPVLLKGFIQSDPILSTVKDHPKLDQFIEEFHAQLNPPPEDAEGDEPQN